ncbi:glycosyl transferase [Sphingobacterium olei]|uniref:Glycosyl transferase n=1 Tax=Sphingobacterium olei TaxID=2571155 RepID=A0A4U0NYZ1_9SPHI|nr:glycosyl transferase [Sphingobacterium olei]TJZ60107.1 glycosyl transferase [Sphingobacterium olei]
MANSNYTLKERFIAKVLSNTPKIKRFVKRCYVSLNALIYRKAYVIKGFGEISEKDLRQTGSLEANEEFFFGYYDKSSINSIGWVINHVTADNTKFERRPESNVEIVLTNIDTDEILKVGKSYAYTWQQGCRTQWLDDDHLIYNDYNRLHKIWEAKVYSLSARSVIKVFDRPVQDAYKKDYILSLDYQRLYEVTEDYGYNNQGKLNDDEKKNLRQDGIFITDYVTEVSRLLFSLEDIANLEKQDDFDHSFHTINHIMINKEGNYFIFIHRYYRNGVRKDRLIGSDFKSLKVISDHDMVSHCCWFDDNTVYGYLRHDGKDGYYFIDLNTLKFTLNSVVDKLGVGDGHPSVYQDNIVFDTYPDRSRMQTLYVYNKKNDTVEKLFEVYQSPSFKESSRCDLHPRFNGNGDMIFFDSVFEDKRKQYFFKLK